MPFLSADVARLRLPLPAVLPPGDLEPLETNTSGTGLQICKERVRKISLGGASVYLSLLFHNGRVNFTNRHLRVLKQRVLINFSLQRSFKTPKLAPL